VPVRLRGAHEPKHRQHRARKHLEVRVIVYDGTVRTDVYIIGPGFP
jgi:hypothetical protein